MTGGGLKKTAVAGAAACENFRMPFVLTGIKPPATGIEPSANPVEPGGDRLRMHHAVPGSDGSWNCENRNHHRPAIVTRMDRLVIVVAIGLSALSVALVVLALFMPPPHSTRINRADPASHRVRSS